VLVTAELTQLLHDVLTSRVYDVARETALDAAPRLTERLGNEVLLKREDLQPVFSFKLRGAYNKISHLSDAERARGVIASSAGNHAQGVAYSARQLGLRSVIVMPQTTPRIKVDAVRSMGAEVVLVGDSYADAQAHCQTLIAQTGMTFIHPFDDPLVIAGQGTIGAEILRHSQDRLTAVFVPVGGGGLISGIAGYIKALRPDIKIIGVEPFEADAMYRSLAVGRRVHLEHVGIFADGVAVREVGERTFSIVQQTVDEVLRVTNDEICAAIKDIFDDTRTVMEPAGALATAGLKTWVERESARNQSLVAVLSGANINFDRLRFVAERAELGEARETLIAITLPERPGSFQKFCSVIGRRTVTEFNYRLSGRQQAHIFVGFATHSRQDGTALTTQLMSAGYETVDLTDNELAKLHVRHMVGGHAPEVRNERLCRFEFPDFGRVLAGFEVADGEMPAFRTFLDELAYPYTLEDQNPAYRFFLG
jgi:threonine dehydratase